MNNKLVIENVSYKYNDKLAVDNLSFEIKSGQILGLLGSNGSGKTTTFRMIMGLLKPIQGSIKYNDKIIDLNTADKIGYLIEERSLMTKYKVKDLIYYFARLKGVEKEDIDKRAKYWLERFDLISFYDKKIKTLSKGNQQKIQFIISIINNPEVLILDEPFSGLDIINTRAFIEVINDFSKNGSIIIFSSHQLDDVESFCQKVVVLKEGRTILNGFIEEIKDEHGKENIKLQADNIDISKIEKIKGVYEVIQHANEVEIKVSDKSVNEKIFEYVKTLDNVKKYDVTKAKLSDIFIDKVGGLNE